MKNEIIKKVFTQSIISIALSILYMVTIATEYMKISWPLSFIAVLFLALAWVQYLGNDGVSFVNKLGDNKLFKKFKTKGIMDYVDEDVQHISDFTDDELFKIKIISNIATAILLLLSNLF